MIEADYLRFYHRFVKAMQALDAALARRRRLRGSATARRDALRRPSQCVAVRPGAAVREAGAARIPLGEPSRQRSGKGHVMEWPQFTPASRPPSGAQEPAFDFDIDGLLDDAAMREFLRVKSEYEAARKAYFRYARVIQAVARARRTRDRSRDDAQYQSNLQWLKQGRRIGTWVDPPDPFEVEQQPVLAFCERIWKIYQRERDLQHAQRALLAAVGEAQLFGLEDAGVVPEMLAEADRLNAEYQARKGLGGEDLEKVLRESDEASRGIQRGIRGE